MRSLQDQVYMLEALKVLRNGGKETPSEYAWLHSPAKVRQCLLAELGRWDDPDAIRQWAAWLCEHKPNSKRAVAVLRQARLDRVPEGDWIELLGELERVAETYKLRRSITDDDVAKALLTLGRAYQEEQDKTEDSK